MNEKYLETLNYHQRAAVTFGDGTARPAPPLLIIAGAGSGKTRTLAHRVAHLLALGADPRRILLMTFSRRAAKELKARVENLLAGIGSSYPVDALDWAGTFHSIGAKVLQDHALAIGLDPEFSIHDREDSSDLMNLVRHKLRLSETHTRFPSKGTCLSIYSRCVNSETPLADVLQVHFPWCATWEDELKGLFSGYVQAKQSQNVLDYDDLLLAWAQIMEDPDFSAFLGSFFDHVLIDEYQDTNRLQARILMSLKPDGRGLCVVGDDAQSIYAFRAATVRNILDFPDAFAPKADVITLDRNYRSTATILAAANSVIGEARDRFTKDLWTERNSSERPRLVTNEDEADQARCVVDQILEDRERGLRLTEQAVLFRTSHHSGPLEIELTRRNVPFVKFGGLKFLDSAHVKDVLNLLRFHRNSRDQVAGFRVLQLLPGIGPKSAGKMLNQLTESAEPHVTLATLAPPKAAHQDWPGFVTLLSSSTPWPDQIAQVRAWYEPRMEQMFEDAEMRKPDLLQLEQISYGFASLEDFLTEMTLDPPDATGGHAGDPHKDEDYLILSTIHSAKGMEWKSVHVLNVVDGCIPSDLATGTTEQIEEERRLLYVAMTRAKDNLSLHQPLRFYETGQGKLQNRHVYAMRSRFLPDQILGHFDQIAPAPRGLARITPPTINTMDIKARMREMWS
ncbi:ATP-dependent helicase [Litorisediminicola beolgyonensis]|uniref:DNA 3'-5' helicase n=1 Tax=Litorisediminicola beolgyonensis TaxID=1173614 RepID=A0ABW3ZJB3_9RHOB